MKHLMKAELYKFKKDLSTWVIAATLICCASISIFTGVYTSAENTFVSLGKDYMILVLACVIYSGLTLTDDFSNRTIIHAVAYGNKRFSILAAKGCRYILGCTVIVISYMLISTSISVPLLGISSPHPNFLWDFVFPLVLAIPLYWGISMIFLFIAFAIRKAAVAMGISVALSIMMVVFTNKAYYAASAPDRSVLRYLPTIQLPMIFDKTFSAGDYRVSLLLSLLIVVIYLFGSLAILNRAEL